MSKKQNPADRGYAVAVSTGDRAYLFLRLRRSPSGDVYVAFPRRDRKGWNPHSSYHASGQHHQKSFNHKALSRNRQKPDEAFRGTVNIVTTPIGQGDAKAIDFLYDPNEFQGALLMPERELGADPRLATTYVSVDLAEPGVEPPLMTGAVLLREEIFKDRAPWIVARCYKYDPGAQAPNRSA